MDKIDVDKDGYVTERELEDWVRHVANRYVLIKAVLFYALSCVCVCLEGT